MDTTYLAAAYDDLLMAAEAVADARTLSASARSEHLPGHTARLAAFSR